MTLFCDGHLGFFSTYFFKPSLFFGNYLLTTDEADGCEVLEEMYVALFPKCPGGIIVYPSYDRSGITGFIPGKIPLSC